MGAESGSCGSWLVPGRRFALDRPVQRAAMIHPCGSARLAVWALAAWLPWLASAQTVSSWCDLCGQGFEGAIYSVTDQVEQSRKWMCGRCAQSSACFICGVPARSDYLALSDGRIACKRDKEGLVLDEEDAVRLCREVDGTLAALLGRFTEFPRTNVHLRLADRMDVRALVGVAGHDVTCPNLLGYMMTLQKPAHLHHDVRLLIGLQKGVLQATYAHELAHAWVNENVSKARRLVLHPDALEGFCELIGFLVAQAYGDRQAINHILNNEYTRGQVLLFIEAERRYGLADVLDWVRFGHTTRLREDALHEVRDVALPGAPPPRPVAEVLFIPSGTASAPATLEVTSITIGPRTSVATINGRSFELNERRRVPLGGTNLLIRCVAIEPDAVMVERTDTGRRERLELPGKRSRAAMAP